jgi:hypothetical protein
MRKIRNGRRVRAAAFDLRVHVRTPRKRPLRHRPAAVRARVGLFRERVRQSCATSATGQPA